MKKLFFFTAFFLAVTFQAQENNLPIIDGKITFEKIISFDNTPKDILYDKTLIFMSSYLYSANDEIQLKDKELGKIIAKSASNLKYNMGSGLLSFMIVSDVKDNKIRIRITNFTFIHQNYPSKLILVEEYPKSWAGKKSFYNSIFDISQSKLNDFEKKIMMNQDNNW